MSDARSFPARRFPATPIQRSIAMAHELDPTGQGHVIVGAVPLDRPVDREVMALAWRKVVDRHDALRTTLVPDPDGDLAQLVAGPGTGGAELGWRDLSNLTPDQRRDAVDQERREVALTQFRLAEGPLIRATLVRLGPHTHELLLSAHHAIVDAHSIEIVLRELLAEGVDRQISKASGPRLQYPEVVRPQWPLQDKPEYPEQARFWNELLDGVPQLLDLPTDTVRDAAPGRGARQKLGLTRDLVDAMRAVAGRFGASPFMLILAALGVVLGRHAQASSVLVGTPVSHRTTRELEQVVGPLLDMVPLPVRLDGPTFDAVLRRARDDTLAVLQRPTIAFDELVEQIRPERVPGRNPLVQVLLAVHEQTASRAGLPPLMALDTGTAMFDLAFTVHMGEPERSFIQYRVDRFAPSRISALTAHLRCVLRDVLADPTARVRSLPMVEPGLAGHPMSNAGGPDLANPEHATVHELIAARARAAPDAIGLVAGREQVSFQALDQRSNRLAWQLLRQGVRPEQPVAICGRRSVDLVVAMVAVLKAGGAVLPVEPDAPASRKAALLGDAEVSVILADGCCLGPGGLDGPRTLPLAGFHNPGPDSDRAPTVRVHPDQLAFLLYTSGSTGSPKGTMLPHRAVVNYVRWCLSRFDVTAGRGVPVHGAIDFDTTVITSLLPPLCAGQRVLLATPPTTVEAVASLAVPGSDYTYVALTPSQLAVLGDQPDVGPELARLLVVGGEAMPRELAARWRRHAELINEYGPTETVAACGAYTVPPQGDLPTVIPIGQPIDNCTMVVRDECGTLAAVGVAGELYVGGAGVGRGYVGRPGATAAAFLPDPWAWRPGRRAYRTGDLARWRPDGMLEFLGRDDDQVKIRGHRVELGEVDAVLRQHPTIQDSMVASNRSGSVHELVAYVAIGDIRPSVSELHAFARQRLPAHLCPARYGTCRQLPRLSNGKVDRHALALITLQRPGPLPGGVAPRTPDEAALVAIWRELLGVEQVGVTDNFFALGGHSLAATRMTSLIRERFGVSLPLSNLFADPTVAGLAAALGRDRTSVTAPDAELAASGPGPAADKADLIPLSYAQEGIWFDSQLRPDEVTYNSGGAYLIQGLLRADWLADSLDDLLDRHDVLRSVVVPIDGVPFCTQLPREATRLQVRRVTDPSGNAVANSLEEWCRALINTEVARPFDLAAGPLFRATLVEFGPHDHLLMLVIHHLVVDGWSMEPFFRELRELYRARAEDRVAELVPLPICYRDFVVWQRRRLTSATSDELLGYWQEQLAGAPAELSLPADGVRDPARIRGGHLTSIIPGSLRIELEELSRANQVTLFVTLLAGFGVLLGRYARQSDLLIGVPAANRVRPETEHLVGLFVNILVMRLRLDGNATTPTLLRHVWQVATDAYAHQEQPLGKLVEAHRPARHRRQDSLIQVLFNLQYEPNPTLRLDGLDITPIRPYREVALVDLAVSVECVPDGLLMDFSYDANLFEPDTIRQMAQRWRVLLAAMAAEPGRRINQLTILTPEERDQLLAWSAPPAPEQG